MPREMNSAKKMGNKPAISFVLHAHQPLGYGRFQHINREIYKKSYLASAELNDYIGKTQGKETGVSLNVSGSVLIDLLAHQDDHVASRVSQEFRKANRISQEIWGETELMLQGSLFHSIVPLLPAESQELQHRWSRDVFRYFFGNEPSGVWLPEQAYDSSALGLVAKTHGGWTVLPQWAAPSGTPTSVPHKADTPEGDITLFVYDKYLSDAISWKRAGWDFKNLIKGHNGHDKLAWLLAMDLETFGEHGRDEREKYEGPWQLNNILYHQIPGEGYTSLPVQALFSSVSHDELGRISLSGSGSWSCLCKGTRDGLEKRLSDAGKLETYGRYLQEMPDGLDGILRWTAPCACTNRGSLEANLWKIPFKSGLTRALRELHRIYADSTEQFLNDSNEALGDYMQLKLRAIDGTLSQDDVLGFGEKHFRQGRFSSASIISALSMMEGLYHMEAAQTSCATYWENPRRIEPTYNIIHAGNAIRLFKLAQQHIPYGEMEKALSETQNNLERSIHMSEPSLIRQYVDALGGKYQEHTHLDRMTREL